MRACVGGCASSCACAGPGSTRDNPSRRRAVVARGMARARVVCARARVRARARARVCAGEQRAGSATPGCGGGGGGGIVRSPIRGGLRGVPRVRRRPPGRRAWVACRLARQTAMTGPEAPVCAAAARKAAPGCHPAAGAVNDRQAPAVGSDVASRWGEAESLLPPSPPPAPPTTLNGWR